MYSFTTPTQVTTLLDVPAGRIQLIAADRTDTVVEIRPADAGKNRDIKAAETTEVHYQDGILRIHATEPNNRILGHTGAVEITVQLPTGSHLQGKTAAADLRGVGRLGDVTYESAAGTVKLDETAITHLTLQAGDLTIGRLTGPAQLTTQKGDITITEAHTGTVTLTTQAGNLTIGTPRTTSATLDAATSYGRVHNSLTNTEGPDAALQIHATTHYGDITARSI